MSTRIEAPGAGEYHPGFEKYIARVKDAGDVVEFLKRQLEDTESLLRQVDPSRQTHRYAPGKWSVKEVVGHLTDAERIFSYRLLRFARADETALPGFDENTYVEAANFDDIAWSELVDEFAAVRRATILLLNHLPAVAWTRAGVSNGNSISVRALAFIMAGHVDHHVAILRERYF
jgi:hypothetical protein